MLTKSKFSMILITLPTKCCFFFIQTYDFYLLVLPFLESRCIAGSCHPTSFPRVGVLQFKGYLCFLAFADILVAFFAGIWIPENLTFLNCGPGLANPPLLVEYKIFIFASMGYIIVSYSIHINKYLAKLMLKEGPPSPAGGLATPQVPLLEGWHKFLHCGTAAA